MKVKLGEYIQEYSVRNKANEDIPVYSVTNTQGFCQDYFGKEVASKDKSTYKIVPKGYFAYNPSRINVGSVDWQRDEDQVIVSPLYNVFSVSPELNQQYLYYYLKSDFALHRIKAVATGSVRDNLKLEMLKNFPIRIPSVEEQEYIVQALDKAKNIIDLRRSVLQKLDDLIKARFVELFGNPLDGTAKYPIHQVGEVANSVDPQPSHRTPPIDEDGIPYVSTKDCDYKTGKIDFEGARKVSRGVLEEHLNRYTLHDGDFIIGKIGTIGKPVFVPARENYTLSANVVLVQPNSDLVSPYFLKYSFESDFVERQFAEAKNSTSQAAFGIQKVRTVKVMNPNLNIQRGFEDFVKQIDKSKHHSPHLPIPPLKWYPLPKNEVPIMEEKIIAITNEMAEVLNIAQLKKLQEVLVKAFSTEEPERKPTNQEYLRLFLEAKSIEGCSPRTLQYYEVTVQHLFAAVNLPVRKMTTERMREYLSDYQQRRNCSKATIDNIRRNISSFFSWLEEEDHILKSPMRRIHKIKTKKTVKEVISD